MFGAVSVAHLVHFQQKDTLLMTPGLGLTEQQYMEERMLTPAVPLHTGGA